MTPNENRDAAFEEAALLVLDPTKWDHTIKDEPVLQRIARSIRSRQNRLLWTEVPENIASLRTQTPD